GIAGDLLADDAIGVGVVLGAAHAPDRLGIDDLDVERAGRRTIVRADRPRDSRDDGDVHGGCRTPRPRQPQAHALPATALTSAVVSALPPMPHSPDLSSCTRTQVRPRIFSPSMPTIVSVTFSIISFFWAGVKTPSTSWISTSGIVLLLLFPVRFGAEPGRVVG